MASYIPLIRQHSKAKIVLRTHNVEYQIWERHLVSEKNWLKKQYLQLQNKRLKLFEITAFTQADAIVTITAEDQKNISALVPTAKTHVSLTGISLQVYKNKDVAQSPNTFFHFAYGLDAKYRSH